MTSTQHNALASDAIGVGSYTAPEAARLLRTTPLNVNRWLRGYTYKRSGEVRHMPPLWTTQHASIEDHLEIGFRDLIELRFVKAFVDAGVGLLAIRNCLEYARECAKDDRPFSTRRFQTDGRTIFLESIERAGEQVAETKLLDLKKKQYVFKQVIERTFKDLDIEDAAVARWRPFHGKKSIVIDPGRAFGQPIVSDFGVPTVALADAVEAEGSVEEVARIFDVTVAVVRDAVQFETDLKRAA
ncbi:DUF433 domain-containing protein [Agrobacterium tumefaciens]|uniref:DUF433 domain-containing protein n=1 Tax=Agrobacterium tumefaciens TaxID=358 RepID=UPI000DD3536D|nr:DUF433 domain-containing protein [Agrobacterium tumefaciens]MDP9874061.1 uncharacterized protein (DUF433 family) [Agrobacterium tumefaciens]MRH96562.1 DUF433 domain-containing protein [Agrobacterium tumefaciens]